MTGLFSENLRKLREEKGLSQKQLGKQMFVNNSTVARWENGSRLPPLTLQPIAENAVKHGMNPYAGPLHVMIRTFRTESASVIVVTDNGPGFDAAEINETHTTLMNIRQRLEMMCGGKMTIMPREGGGSVVKVTIP